MDPPTTPIPGPSSPPFSTGPSLHSTPVRPSLSFAHHSLGSTASFVGILKAAALSELENSDFYGSSRSPDKKASIAQQKNSHKNLKAKLELDSEDDDEDAEEEEDDDDDDEDAEEEGTEDEDDDGESAQDDLVDTPPELSPKFNSFRGPSQLGYPSPKALQGLACELINQQKRVADLAVRKGINSSTFTPEPSSHRSSLNQSTPRCSSPLQISRKDYSGSAPITVSDSNNTTQSSCADSESHVSSEERLHRLEEQFGVWPGKDAQGQPETESWIAQVPGVLYRSVLVNGLIVLTDRRLCYLAYLPTFDKGQIIRSGSVTVKADSRFNKRRRRWVELRTDSLTEYRLSTELFRPLSSYHFSEIQRILPISSGQSRTLSLRLLDGRLIVVDFDTSEAADLWHQDFVRALFSFKTDYSNQIKMMLPLSRINSVHRETFESIAKMMVFEVDCAPSFCRSAKSDVIEQHSDHPSTPERPRIELSYYLKHDPFDDTVIDAITHAKHNASQHLFPDSTPAPLLELLDHSPAEDEAEAENITSGKADSNNSCNSKLANRFMKAFGLDASEKLTVYSCALLRTLPTLGHMVLSNDYFCFWRRGTVITQDYKLRIPIKDIGQVKEATAFGFTRFGIAIELAGAPDIRLDFSSKSTREEVMQALEDHAQAAKAEEKRINRRLSNMPIPKPLGQNTEQFKLASPALKKQRPVVIDKQQIERPVKAMKIICLAIGSRGDVQPYISLAKRLMQDGHTVTIASHPEYRPWVESFGILYRDVGGDPAALMKLSVEHPFFSTGFFKEGLGRFRTWLDDLFMESWLACRDSGAELLIESPSTFAGIHIAEALRIPYFRAFTMTWTSTSTYPQAFASNIDLGPSYNLLSYSLFDNLIWRAMSGQVNRWRKQTLKIPSTSLEKMQPYKVPFLYNFSSVVVPKPLDWRDHVDVTGYWFLDQSHGEYTPPADLVAFIDAARQDQVPLIYIGFGSVTVSDPTAVTKAIYAAVVQAGVRAIVAKGWSERGNTKNSLDDAPIDPPAQVYDLHSVPHDWLFPQVDAVCHHGGAGTTGISLRYGVPTLIHPFFGDQPFWADRVTKLGAGMRVDSLTTQSLSDAFIKATGDRIMKEKASQVGEKIRAEDGPTRAVNFIYQYLDFALERTEHRIARTSRKKRWVSSVSGCAASQPAASVDGSHPELESPALRKADLPPCSASFENEDPNHLSDSSPDSPSLLPANAQGKLADPPQSPDDGTLTRKKSIAGGPIRSYSHLIKIPNAISPVKSWSKIKKIFLHPKVIPNVG
ncbi:hypothetical protein PGT21_034058 [Puccinia graminis f. sp. tritici]|uniref:sterol 3beta-glucosyltransferase n=2 Tax=Puccinia graminis f. sp. tritici TaxID=56615 RepID=E3K647_PUCGT|nr:uncharacterized protein PGTG_05939 [Puccinia graminis f. sp. tritici CRL 75-36-700-3]EFP79618.2 hypothetical protein PGTG_05939 [Puccinia graminis f. sp. tritici CRL 75-36-700-3]KAA1119786.1 hypothetical protein PGT21_034058 [Puccinia graminis f. sp. tritici]